jgi:pyridoxal phosphate enzyme (YggS family)
VSIDPAVVAEHYRAVQQRIAAARAQNGGTVRSTVQIVCVTKGFGTDAIDAVRAAGAVAIGESYAQELLTKVDHLTGLDLHFIGRLQTNKVRAIAQHVALWQSVDREPLAIEIAKRAPGAAVLVQVNSSGEASKGGCEPDDTEALVERCQALGLDVQGLMTVGRTGPPSGAREGFALTRAIADRLGLEQCSMGMTDDLEIAVQEGATMVRVGSALFGPRPRADHSAPDTARPATLR